MKFYPSLNSLLLLTLLLPVLANAGAGPSNGGGGNALVCFSTTTIADQVRSAGHQVTDEMIQTHQVTSIESVDLHEALLPEGFDGAKAQVIPLDPNATFEADLKKIATRFDTSVPRLGAFIREGIAAFDGENTRLEDNGIPYMNDANLQVNFDHDNCTLVTLALQEQVGSSSILRLDNRLFSSPLHSNQSRAILLLHEMIYREARLLGQKDSKNTRLLLGAMINQNHDANNPTGTVWGMIKYAHDLGFLSLDVSETYLEQFRIKLGQMALQQAWKFYQDYNGQNPGEDINALANSICGSSSGYNARGEITYTSVSDGCYFLFNDLSSSDGYYTDADKAKLEQAKTLFKTYDAARSQYVRNMMITYSNNSLVSFMLSQIKNVPSKDMDILNHAASEAYAPIGYMATEYLELSGLTGSESNPKMTYSMNLLHFLAQPKDFGLQSDPTKAVYAGFGQPANYAISGISSYLPDPGYLTSMAVKSQTNPSTTLTIDLNKVYSDITCADGFNDPASEFNYPLPTLN